MANTNRPAMPDFGKLPSGRPSAGELGDFLGVDPPTRPASNPSRPMLPAGNRDTGFERPNIGEKVGQRDTLPAVVRPDRNHGLSPRPEPGNRLAPDRRPDIQIGDVNIGNNNVISNKPRWATIDNNRVSAINRRWSNQLNSATTLPARVPGRFQDWGDAIRDHWSGSHYPGYFRPDWWARHQFRCSGWHYFYAYTYYPYTYWWGTPTYNDVVTWCNLNAAASVASQPVYYDYGNSGNVIYQENQVYIEGQAVAGADEFAQSAALLSTVDEPEDTKDAEEAEWMPLGTFALTADPADVNPSRIVQLAVNRQGIVSGTLYNNDTDQLQAIQGRVDKDTQRVAMRLGESEDVVVETGLYNLTQDEASVLVHYGSENHDEYLLVRLPSPEVSASGN
ncbi:hypothetical protein LOC67_00825 [Stieleria sp. JC731]|uniref:hypothetical protein n=1 Tax=Pirellulaceae TaxID=2691357 RepID=UPI001E654CEF|nr:hypothetical protein [Stieleria sp. JC731]MCC9599085.1 hypothetical protein [Stieleria sp. JC731]